MRILTIASQKGGAGKTTLAAHLAVEAERAGAGPVAVVDTDPQGSLGYTQDDVVVAIEEARWGRRDG